MPRPVQEQSQSLALVVLGLFVGAALLQAKGTVDMPTWIAWMSHVRGAGPVEGYRLINADYPPGCALILYVLTRMADRFGIPDLEALKLGLLGCTWLSTAIYWLWTRRLDRVAMLLFALTLSAVGLAYLDVFVVPTLLGAIWALSKGRSATAGALFAVAALTKWQPLILGPFLALRLLRESPSWRPSARGAAGGAGVVAFAIAIYGHAPLVDAWRAATSHAALSFQGLNLGWIIQTLIALHRGIPVESYVVIAPPEWAVIVCRGAFVLFYGICCASLWRRRAAPDANAWLVAGLGGILAYAMFNIGVHENHLFIAMLLAIVSGTAAPFWTVLASISLALFYGIEGAWQTPVRHLAAASVGIALVALAGAAPLWWNAARKLRN